MTHQAGTRAIQPQVAHENGAKLATSSSPDKAHHHQRYESNQRSNTLKAAKRCAERQLFKRSFPDQHFQAFDPLEFADVGRDERSPKAAGMGGDEQVEGAD